MDGNEILKHLRNTVEFLCALIYAPYLSILNKKPRRVVLFYHAVRKQDIEKFKEQMVYLANRCKVVKPSGIKTEQTNSSDFIVAITFDDAFASVIENAVPILKRYGLPAAVFVPAGNLGKLPSWNILDDCLDKNEAVMSEKQITQLNNDGFEIFSHTLSHPVLTEINDNALRDELSRSKQALEKIIRHEVCAISYPHGEYDLKVCDAAKRTGYRLGFTIDPYIVDGSTGNMRIGRFAVSPQDSLFKFKLKISGAYQVVKHLQALKKCLSRLRQ